MPTTSDATTSRILTPDDPRMDVVAGVRLPQHWHTRPYEYAWAAGFAGPGLICLDAGCGISHPFKWHLAAMGGYVEAIDTDRLAGVRGAEFWQAVEADLGKEDAYSVLESGRLPHIRCLDLRATDYSDAAFDRIFCISVLEHMDPPDRAAALREFHRVLTPDGLVVLTVDCPPVVPTDLIAAASEAGLVPAGPVDPHVPALPPNRFVVFRLLLRKGAA